MPTRESNHVIDYLLSEYIDEVGRNGTLYQNEPRQDVLTDLLTDIRHYCDANQIDFELSIQRSELHKSAESPKR